MCGTEEIWTQYSIFYFIQWPKNAQLIDKLSHSFYMFRHCFVILREFVVSTLPSHRIMSNAVAGDTIYNLKLFHIFKLCYQLLHVADLCNLAKY